MKNYLIIVLLTFSCLIGQSLMSQELPRNATVGDISNLKDDISNRRKNIANNEAEISEERRWVSSVKTSVIELKNNLTARDEPVDITQFKNEINALIDRLSKLNCEDLANCKQELENVLSEFNIITDNRQIIDVFDEPREWLKIQQKFRLLYSYFPNSRSNTLPFNKTECEKIKVIFSNSEIKNNVKIFVEKRGKEIDILNKENSQKLEMLILVEQEINKYNQELNKAWDKANTKMSLQTNLYLMILIIGLLSIATIGIVRWFPTEVMKEWVESGQVIQFVTVMILLSVIMALGLAGLLGENTLGTLLGGIGGYVLSQGVGRSAARAALKDFKSKSEGNTANNN